MKPLRALLLNCTLKPSPAPSSTDVLLGELAEQLDGHGVTCDSVRVVDHQVRFGVGVDEGDGDAWPELRQRMLASDILVIGTPIWLGQPSSVAKMVLERLDAELGESDDDGRFLTMDKVAGVAVVGNEDGAHHTSAEIYQGLSDVGFTIPPNAVTYWVGEAMGGIDYADLDERPEKTAETTKTLASYLAHLARVLIEHPYPAS